MAFTPVLLLPIQQKQGSALRSALVELRVAVLDSIQGQRELRSLGMVARQHDVVDRLTHKVQRFINRKAMRKAWENAYAGIATSACSMIMVIILTGRVLDGTLDPSLLPVALVFSGLSTMPTIMLLAMIGRIGEIGACATRINEILDAEDPIPSQPIAVEPVAGSGDGESEADSLIAENVSFAYTGQKVLDDISVEVHPQRSIAVVGSSGAGKTTFANLVMRFLDPDSGAIRFNGKDLRGYQPDEYRQKLALIPQDCHIFAGSIRNNLTLARPDATDEEIWQALKAARISQLVESLGGLDAAVGDRGTTLSGEKARNRRRKFRK